MEGELSNWDPDLSDAVIDDIRTVAAAMSPPASLAALTFHDACPPNRVLTASGVRILDLEMAAFRHPMIDGAYGAIGHLRCNDGLTVPVEIRRGMTAAYRERVLTGYPEYVDDDRFSDDLAAASAVWLVELLRRFRRRTDPDRPVGFFGTTGRQRVLAILDAFSDLSDETNRLTRLGTWSRQLRAGLDARWGPTPPLPVFPGLR